MENDKTKSRLQELKDQLNTETDITPTIIPEEVEVIKAPVLTDKQSRFIDEYLVDFNGLQAAIRAGYSENTAGAIAYENLNKPYLKAEITKRKQEFAIKNGIQRELILEELFILLNDAKADPEGMDRASVLKALDMMNKMSGYYSQVVTNVNIEVPLFNDID